MYEAAYTAESLAAQMKNPGDRLELAAKPVTEAVGGKYITGGYCFGDYDGAIIYEAPDDTAAVSVALVVAAGGAVKSAGTTKLLSGQEWIAALQKAQGITSSYRPAR